MKEHPIIFTGDSIRAIRDRRKTMTRRPVTWYRHGRRQPLPPGTVIATLDDWRAAKADPRMADPHGLLFFRRPVDESEADGRGVLPSGVIGIHPEYAVGDRLWVRETWASAYGKGCFGTMFKADGAFMQGKRRHELGPHYDAFNPPPWAKWRPSIHMPRWASRMLLEVTSVRVELLHDVSEEDVWAEGIEIDRERIARMQANAGVAVLDNVRATFGAAWDKLNGHRAPWANNNPVYVIGFKEVVP